MKADHYHSSLTGNTMKHKHYDTIIAFANGANIQVKRNNGNWLDSETPGFDENLEYRVAPHVIRIGPFSFNSAETCKPPIGTPYWAASFIGRGSAEHSSGEKWDDGSWDNNMFENGLVHLTKENAVAHGNVLAAISLGHGDLDHVLRLRKAYSIG